MRVAGIIAEYNPFHNGHQYHMDTARSRFGADYLIVVMSGDFTQRGEPALMDKYLRAQAALSCGADLVLELPVVYACASAPYFSQGAVSLLSQLGVTDRLIFGSECGDIALLKKAASLLAEQPPAYTGRLKSALKEGRSYPAAQADALLGCAGQDTAALLSQPNNLLGIEYCRQLLLCGSSIEPCTLKRKGGLHTDTDLSGRESSALAIRNALQNGTPPDALSLQLPKAVSRIMQGAYGKTFPVFPDMLSELLHYRLLFDGGDGFSDYLDVSADLSDRIQNRLAQYRGFSSFCDLLKTKELTHTRIRRSLLHILLDIRKTDPLPEGIPYGDVVRYARILGFRSRALPLLKSIRANAGIPLLSRLSGDSRRLDEAGQKQLKKDMQAAHLYHALILHVYGTKLPHELSRQVIRY